MLMLSCTLMMMMMMMVTVMVFRDVYPLIPLKMQTFTLVTSVSTDRASWFLRFLSTGGGARNPWTKKLKAKLLFPVMWFNTWDGWYKMFFLQQYFDFQFFSCTRNIVTSDFETFSCEKTWFNKVFIFFPGDAAQLGGLKGTSLHLHLHLHLHSYTYIYTYTLCTLVHIHIHLHTQCTFSLYTYTVNVQ